MAKKLIIKLQGGNYLVSSQDVDEMLRPSEENDFVKVTNRFCKNGVVCLSQGLKKITPEGKSATDYTYGPLQVPKDRLLPDKKTRLIDAVIAEFENLGWIS